MLLSRILWGRHPLWQFVLAGLGFLLGLLILLLSLQLYLDIERVLHPQVRDAGGDFLVLNKNVSVANSLGLGRSVFIPTDIDSLRRQPFVAELAPFTAGQFQASAEAVAGIAFYTLLFFEAVPDSFLDVKDPPGWDWYEGQETLPIVISQDFLNLYNFGFALSQGLPQLSRQSVTLVPLKVTIAGAGGRRSFNARIVGFSDRISSVLVPQKFMDWANQTVGSNNPGQPSRLIAKVNDAADPALARYLETHGFQTNNDRLRLSRTGGLLQTVMQALAGLGAFFLLLSFVIFAANFRMLVAEAKEEIRLLLQLGYRTGALAWPLIGWFAAFLGLAGILAFVGVRWGTGWLHTFLNEQGLELPGSVYPLVWAVGAGFLGFSLLINVLSVYRLIGRNA